MKKATTTEKRTKPLTNTGSKSRASRSSSKDHARNFSNRYKEDAKMEEERMLTSPVQEIVPQPTEVNSNCQMIAREFEQFIESSKASQPEKTEQSSSNLYAWGSNKDGQICTAAKFGSDPILLSLPAIGRLAQVACGRAHTVMVTEDGAVFAMGDNSEGQLGIAPSTSSRGPFRVEGLQSPHVVACGAYTSFALVNGQIFGWGKSQQGAFDSINQNSSWKPTEIALPYRQKVKTISAGNDHCATITNNDQLYVWGSNNYGQLGLKDKLDRKMPTTSTAFQDLQVTKVSCGNDFTFVITQTNEILVTGKLPFTIEQAEGMTDCVMAFQSVAQFEKGVEVLQIETTKFASILVKPGNDEEPKELFMWGQTPLGLFQEPTSLNQLVSECQEGQQTQTFDVKMVKNGQNFSIFVDQLTGMTYQLSTEDLKDPYESQGQVSLSELRDVKFNDSKLFACGADFIIGQCAERTQTRKSPSPVMSPERSNKVVPEMLQPGLPRITEENNIDENFSEISSASKVIKLNKVENEQQLRSMTKSDCVNIFTPSNRKGQTGELDKLSEHSFRQDALFKDDLTDASCAFMPDEKAQAAASVIKIQEEEIRKVESPENTDKSPKTTSFEQKKDMTFNQTRELQHKTGKPPLPKRDESEGEEKMHTARDRSSGSNPGITPRDRVQARDSNASAVFKTAHNDYKKQPVNISDFKSNELRKLDYSPNVSPIPRQSIVRDSIADLANEMNAIAMHQGNDEHSSFQPFECYNHSHQPSEVIHTSSLCQVQPVPHAYGCRQVTSDEPYLSSHGPHIQNRFSHYQRNMHHQSPFDDARQVGRSPLSSRLMPLQQSNSNSKLPLASAMNGNGSNQKQFVGGRASNVALQPTNLNSVFQSIDGNYDTRVVNMSNLHASYCGPFVAPQLDQSIYQLELESMLVKDKADVLEQSLREEKAKRVSVELSHKAELEQVRAQSQELMRQLEKASKDYAKLMSQIDEDQEENLQLREKVRSYECRLDSFQLQQQESIDKNAQLQIENTRLISELKESQAKIAKMAEEQTKSMNVSSKACQSELCEQRVSDFEETIQKKSQIINDLARKLGGIELENKELTQELKDRNEAHQHRLNDLKNMFKQECSQEQEKNEQLQRQVNELKAQIDQMRKIGLESCRSTKDIGITTMEQQQLINFFDAASSPSIVKKVEEPMVIHSTLISGNQVSRNQGNHGQAKGMIDTSDNHKRVVSTVDLLCASQDVPSFVQPSRDVSPGLSENITPIRERDVSADSGASGQRRRRLRNERISSQKDIISDFGKGFKSAREAFKLPANQESFVNMSTDFGASQKRESDQPTFQASEKVVKLEKSNPNLGSVTERSTSRLRAPTQIAKSPGLTATLEMITQQQQTNQTNESHLSIDVNHKPLTKNNSMTGLTTLTSRQVRPMQTMSQSNLQVANTQFTKRHQTPNMTSSITNRPSSTTLSTKVTTQNQATTPRRICQQPMPSARGPPSHLAQRFEAKSGKVTPVAEIKRLTQSASSTSIHVKRTYDNKRNNLMSKYATHFERNMASDKEHLNQVQTVGGEDSEHLIDIMLNNHMPDTNNGRALKLSELDASAHSIQFVVGSHSPNVRQSYDIQISQQTPSTRNNVLQDSTNGLSTMKEKLKNIQDNKSVLEKKIQEYEQKLRVMQKKRNSRKSMIGDENSSSMYISNGGNTSRNVDTSDISGKLTQRKTPTPGSSGFRHCAINNVPNQPRFQAQINMQPSSRSMFQSKN